MNIQLIRKVFNPTNTISDLWIDGIFFGNILEDVDRGLNRNQSLEELKALKIHGKTAIPIGTYEIIISYSNRFKKFLPLLLDVPAYEGIRIHPGNDENDTEGCLLPGKSNGKKVLSSIITFNRLYSILLKATKKEKIFITIESSK